jgi:hypothetical protein
MRDLSDPRWIKLKGFMFLLLGLGSATLLIIQCPTIQVVAPLLICIWAFCRSYYFAFYVIEHYVDPGFKFSGLLAFLRYVMSRK